MIVRDLGDAWQLVAQPDHADLCGAIMHCWGNDSFRRSQASDQLFLAARRHDDGWAVWEREPDIDRDGRPVGFLEVGIAQHLAFFRAMIDAVADQDPYAGVLASMHAVGLYTSRYGIDPSPPRVFEGPERTAVDSFVAERNAAHDAEAERLGIPDSQRWFDYKLLQFADRLSLYLCLSDFEVGAGADLGPVPRSPEGDGDGDLTLTIDPRGPWETSLDPYPFVRPVVDLTVLRTVLPKGGWGSREEFAEAYRVAEPERRTVTISFRGRQ
jgi:hypothetical protein